MNKKTVIRVSFITFIASLVDEKIRKKYLFRKMLLL